MVSKAWINNRIKLRKLLGCAIWGYLTTTLTSNGWNYPQFWPHFIEILCWCDCFTLRSCPTIISIKKIQMKVILIWINEEITPKLSIGSVHRVGRLPSFLATIKSFPSMIFVTHIPEWLFGYNVERIILKNPSGAVLWANIEVNLILNT